MSEAHSSPIWDRRKVFAFANYVKDSFFRHEGPKTSAYLAFTTLFAVVPLMTVTFSVLSLVPELRRWDTTMREMLFRHVLPDTGTYIEGYLSGFASQASSLTTAGLIMLFLTCMLMLRRIESSFNKIWHVRQARTGINGFLLYWAILSIGPLLMGMAFLLSSYVASLQVLSLWFPWLAVDRWLWSIIPVISTIVVFSLAYIAIPNTTVSIRHGLAGGAFAALLFEAARHVMAVAIQLFPSYKFVYGAFAAVPIFLIWVYVSWVIVLLGAELVQSMSFFRYQGRHASASLPDVLMILWGIHENQKMGNIVIEEKLMESLQWQDMVGWEAYMALLEKDGWVVRQGGGWLILRDLHTHTLYDLAKTVYPDALAPQKIDSLPWQQAFNARLDQSQKQWQEHLNVSLTALFSSVPS